MARSLTMASTPAQPDNRQALSKLEEQLFALIPMKPKMVSSKDLVDLFYGPHPPFNALKIVVGRVNTIAAKLEFTKASIRVKKGERSGPNPMTYWREKA